MRPPGNRRKTTYLAAIEIEQVLGGRAQKPDDSVWGVRLICTCMALGWMPALVTTRSLPWPAMAKALAMASSCVKRPEERSTNALLTQVCSVLVCANLFAHINDGKVVGLMEVGSSVALDDLSVPCF